MATPLALALLAAAAGQPPADLPPAVKEFSQTATYYYKSPDPTLGPKMLRTLLKDENINYPWFKDRQEVFTLIGAQLGDIAAGHPKQVREYESLLPDAPPAGRRVILLALMNCGDKETVKAIDGWLADPKLAAAKPELEALKKHLTDPKRTHVRDRPAKEPKDLDLLWANFMVTGEYAPVSRILDVFDLPDEKGNEVLKRVARWSLGSNLQQHPRLVELVQKHAAERPEGSKRVIDQLIVKFPAEKK